eukprot:Nitzschia sp. Nitz4//scaffold371_size14297//6040//11866//NITZ4_008941-RA/size14297-augustus-gene-0.3-mRNA-1//-1//CDS//3329549584//4466//frame0
MMSRRGSVSWAPLFFVVFSSWMNNHWFVYGEEQIPSCPSSNGTPLRCPTEEGGGLCVLSHPDKTEVPITLDNTNLRRGEICTLIDVSDEFLTNSDLINADIKPIARHFYRTDWGVYPGGDYNHLKFTCGNDVCEVNLDATPSNRVYLLKGYDYLPTYTSRIASFLDRTTFGATRTEIDANLGVNSRYWVKDQMDETLTPMSSHRQLFREYSGDWASSSSTVGLASPDDACAIGARYRNFAFLPSDVGRTLTIAEAIDGKKILKVDGEFRTVVEGEIGYKQGRDISKSFDYGSHTIKFVDTPIGGDIKFVVNDTVGSRVISFNGVLGNPPVQFDEVHQPDFVLDIPKDGSKVVLEDEYGGTESIRELTTSLTGNHCPTGSLANGPRTTVAKLEDGLEYEYWIHSTNIQLVHNTLQSPLVDGGRSAVDASENRVLCSNAPRTFLNEETCVLAPTGCEVDSSFDDPRLVCGSPFEVANVVNSTHGPANHGGFEFLSSSSAVQKESVWLQIALNGKDQLRQRVAWALYQILVVSPNSISRPKITEAYLAYYDIFVRHAFGNYFDILKEVTYSPLMGEMLTYINGRSTGASIQRSDSPQSVDENYAREIMQLFTIGLYQLNHDGTPILDDGQVVETYTNEVIYEYAKVYVGMEPQEKRGNIEIDAQNQIDPMRINEENKDYFPKLGLDNQYIGDGYPLCSDVPYGYFLKKGATFRLLGSDPEPQLLSEANWAGTNAKYVPTLDPESSLARYLCGGSTLSCNPSAIMVLSEDIYCTGVECSIDEPRTFEVASGVWFEYVRPPCVNQAFYNNAKSSRGLESQGFMCSNPLNRENSALCCSASDTTDANHNSYGRSIYFSGELVTHNENDARCDAIGGNDESNDEAALCAIDVKIHPNKECSGIRGGCDSNKDTFWVGSKCNLHVKIKRSGGVAVVHEPLDENEDRFVLVDDVDKRHKMVRNNTEMFFRVDWLDDYVEDCASLDGCSVDPLNDETCFCSTVVTEEAIYTDATLLAQASVDSILSLATIAPFEAPSSGWKNANADVKYTHTGGVLDDSSILQVRDSYGHYHYRKNIMSTVSVGSSTALRFRNPVSFFSLAHPTVRDARNELDAALKHYFYHPNMAPFLAIRLAQRFGISNPSPQYVSTISEAFRTGRYTSFFGSGVYGCMEATIAALVLEPEFQLVDADPMNGSVLEPYLKVVKVMRSLEFRSQEFVPRISADLQHLIGQQAHKLPHVFSFFKPEYQPAGRIADASLVAPEAQVLNGPTIMNMMNMILSFIRFGLNDCFGGIGSQEVEEESCRIGDAPNLGTSTYIPPGSPDDCDQIVDDLTDLLNGGRLTSVNREVIVEACNNGTPSDAVVNTAQLLVTTPEFHTIGLTDRTGNEREATIASKPSNGDYKAVVFVMLKGGMDSYNVLVPGPSCSLNDQYTAVRGSLAFVMDDDDEDKDEYRLKIDASNQGQPCNEFSVHKSLSVVAEMYNKGDLLFMANTGNIDRGGLTPSNYDELTTSTLFAHNHMQEEVQRIDPYDKNTHTGVLGRAKDMLESNGLVVNAIAVDGEAVVLEGNQSFWNPTSVVQKTGASEFPRGPVPDRFEDLVRILNGEGGPFTNVFGELWSTGVVGALDTAATISKALESADEASKLEWTAGSEAWETIYKLMYNHDKESVTNRDLFYTEIGGWDDHLGMKPKLSNRLLALDGYLEQMRAHLKNTTIDGTLLWDKVTIVVASEFGRTLTPNSGDGSDHAWAGNYFMMGGSVKGGQIIGKYPDALNESCPLCVKEDIFRGRLIPTTSWDAIWNGVLQWLGVTEGDLGYCLPNRNNTIDPVEGVSGSFPLYSSADLFDEDSVII